jgi:hypothetical protein
MRWCRLTVTGPDGQVLARVVVQGRGTPDLAAVDEVARAALQAARSGAAVTLGDVAPELAELLDLAGLVVQVEGEPECGEQALRSHESEEELHPGDAAP